MDKQERGILLADQEEFENNIANIRKKLTDMGKSWKKLSEAIISKPEDVIFSDAPDEFNDVPMHLLGKTSFIWREIPQLEIMAKLIQDLKADSKTYNEIQTKLRS